MQHTTESTHEAKFADGGKVVYGAAARQCGIVVDVHVAAQHDVVRHNNAVADLAVVRYVTAGHQVAVVANGGDAILFLGGPVDGNRFPKNIAIANDDLRGCTLITEILRFRADNNAWKEMVFSSQDAVSGERHIVLKSTTATDLHVRTDDAMMSDSNFFVQLGARINDRGMSYDRGHTNQLSGIDGWMGLTGLRSQVWGNVLLRRILFIFRLMEELRMQTFTNCAGQLAVQLMAAASGNNASYQIETAQR